MVYSATANGVNHVFLRNLNSPNPVELTHEKRDISSTRLIERQGGSLPNSHLDQNDSQCTVCEPPLDSQYHGSSRRSAVATKVRFDLR